MLKFDLSDGYYRVPLSPEAALELAVIIPGTSPSTSLIAVPLSLPIGWAQSPPYFCAYTEMAANLSNAALQESAQSEFITHPIEWESQHPVTTVVDEPSIAATYVTPPGQLLRQPIQYTDIIYG
jgi:hypothetical protein